VQIVTTKRLFTAAVLVGFVSATALAQSSDPHVGTWKFNAEKSKGAAFKGGTVKVEPAGDGIKVTVDLVRTDGTPAQWGYTAKYDGKDHPVTGNSPFGDALVLTRVDAKTVRVTNKQGGKVTVTQTVVVSDDGKTRTITSKGTNVKGERVDSMTFYDKL
jgi:transcription elongation GreA/GreB family factor